MQSIDANRTEAEMSRWGIGPVFTLLSIGYGIIVLAVSWYFHPFFRIRSVSYVFLAALGIGLIGIGLLTFIVSVVTVTRAYNAGTLAVNGVYRCCRHPLYASWVVCIVPGIVLIVNTWIGITVPLFMYAVLRVLVLKEERYLEHIFGSKYRIYKRKVPCILPVGWVRSII